MYKYTVERLREIFARRRCVRTDRDARWQSPLKRVDEFVGKRRGGGVGAKASCSGVRSSTPGGRDFASGKTKDYRLLLCIYTQPRATPGKGWLRTPFKGPSDVSDKIHPGSERVAPGGLRPWKILALARGCR